MLVPACLNVLVACSRSCQRLKINTGFFYLSVQYFVKMFGIRLMYTRQKCGRRELLVFICKVWILTFPSLQGRQ